MPIRVSQYPGGGQVQPRAGAGPRIPVGAVEDSLGGLQQAVQRRAAQANDDQLRYDQAEVGRALTAINRRYTEELQGEDALLDAEGEYLQTIAGPRQKGWDDFLQETVTSLGTPRQRELIQPHIERAKQRFHAALIPHLAEQNDAVAVASFQSNIDTERQAAGTDAASGSGVFVRAAPLLNDEGKIVVPAGLDTRSIEQSIEAQDALLEAFIEDHPDKVGLLGEAKFREVARAENRSATWSSVLDQLLARGDDALAALVFDKAKGQLDGPMRAKYNRAVANAAAIHEVSRAVEDVLDGHPAVWGDNREQFQRDMGLPIETPAEAEAAGIDTIRQTFQGDPEKAEAAVAQLKARHAESRALRDRQVADLFAGMDDALVNARDPRATYVKLLTSLDYELLDRGHKDKLALRLKGVSEMQQQVAYRQIEALAFSPESKERAQFRALDLRLYRAELGDKYNEVVKWQEEGTATLMDAKKAIDTTARSLYPKERDTEPELRFREAADRLYTRLKDQLGREPSGEEMRSDPKQGLGTLVNQGLRYKDRALGLIDHLAPDEEVALWEVPLTHDTTLGGSLRGPTIPGDIVRDIVEEMRAFGLDEERINDESVRDLFNAWLSRNKKVPLAKLIREQHEPTKVTPAPSFFGMQLPRLTGSRGYKVGMGIPLFRVGMEEPPDEAPEGPR